MSNARYATAGALNWNAFADPISVQRFLAPGAPIGGWGGVAVRFWPDLGPACPGAA